MRLLIASIVLLACSGCGSIDYDPAVFEKKSFALVSFYGPSSIEVRPGLLVGSPKPNGWTRTLLDSLGAETIAPITSTLPSCRVPTARSLEASAAYMALRASSRPEDEVASLAPLRVIPWGVAPHEPLDLKGLGATAKDLEVDAVVLVSAKLAYTDVYRESGKRGAPHGQVRVSVLIVGADGKQLWWQFIQLDGPDEETSLASSGSKITGSSAERAAVSCAHAALVRALERFAAKWIARGEP